MLKVIALTLLGGTLVGGLNIYRRLQINIAKAKKTGLPYIVNPYFGVGHFSMVFNEMITPLIRALPFSENWEWLKVMDRSLSWRKLRYAEEKYGDTFILVSPKLCYLKTSNAELIAQITQRRSDFHKPVVHYRIVDIFGGSILTAEGNEWKRHKKIIGPSFSEKSNKMVFEESLRQANGMLEVWQRASGNTKQEMKVADSSSDTCTLSLHVICAAGFGVPQIWPGESDDKLQGKGVPGFSGHQLMPHHTISMKECLIRLLRSLLWFAAMSPKTLDHVPLASAKKAMAYFHECRSYFNELLDIKKKEIYLGESEKDSMDLLGPMIKASNETPLDLKSPDPAVRLTKEEIIGNSFIFLFAGHETSANSIHFSLVYLAISLASQKRVHADIDSIVGSKPTSQWDYHTHMPRLYNSMVGAVLNEEMRLVPAIPNIPKFANGDQTVRIDGRQFVIPDNVFIHLNVVGVNRNPRYWPRVRSKISDKDHDMDDFVPERWLPTPTSGIQIPETPTKSPEDKGKPDGLDSTSFETSTPTSLHPPEKGAFLTFSEGPRACPGRRFAQVEITAVLAAVFQKYSVELDVSEWASDEEVARMGREERREVYRKAVESAREKIRRSEQIITLQLKVGDTIPLRFVERGRERFWDL